MGAIVVATISETTTFEGGFGGVPGAIVVGAIVVGAKVVGCNVVGAKVVGA